MSVILYLFSNDENIGGLTEVFVEALSVPDARLKRREVEHDSALGPVGAVGRVVRDLA